MAIGKVKVLLKLILFFQIWSQKFYALVRTIGNAGGKVCLLLIFSTQERSTVVPTAKGINVAAGCPGNDDSAVVKAHRSVITIIIMSPPSLFALSICDYVMMGGGKGKRRREKKGKA